MRLLAPRFVPGFGPGMPLRFGAGTGGASVLEGALVSLAADVVFDSEGLFSEAGGSTGGTTDGFDDEMDLERDCDGFREGSTLEGKSLRTVGESLRTTILDFAVLADMLVVRTGGVDGGGGGRVDEMKVRMDGKRVVKVERTG